MRRTPGNQWGRQIEQRLTLLAFNVFLLWVALIIVALFLR